MAPDDLVARIVAGDVRACARLITEAENEAPGVEPLLQALYARGGRARIIGLTGPPGAGKSTLLDRLIGGFRERGRSVAVLAVDPSSPLTGGAVLGDRVRMARHAADPAVFIRSIASRGMLGGLSAVVGDALTILDAMPWDVILVETVGVGQSEVAIRDHASCVILLQTAEGGDVVQAAKAGILEIGDVFAVNKADLPGAERMIAMLRDMVAMRAAHAIDVWDAPVVATRATEADGHTDAMAAIDSRFAFLDAHPALALDLRRRQVRARVFNLVARRLRARLARPESGDGLNEALDEIVARRGDPFALAGRLMARETP
jgi:LAO/AO transport system kinase